MIFFHRALQGLATALSQDGIINIPFGNELFFILSASQYLYVHSFYPDIFPQSEIKLLNTMSGIPYSILEVNRQLLSGKKISPRDMIDVIPEGHAIQSNLNKISSLPKLPQIVPCEALHLPYATCTRAVVEKSILAFKLMLPIYSIVNVGTKLLFGGSKILQNPHQEFLRIATKSLNSGVFIGAFVGIYQFSLCRIHNLTSILTTLRFIRPLYFLASVFSCLSTYWIDSPQRISNLSFFMAPKSLYGIYKIGFLNGWFPSIPHFETFLFSFSTGIIMSCLRNRPGTLDSIVSKFLKFVVDKDVQLKNLSLLRKR